MNIDADFNVFCEIQRRLVDEALWAPVKGGTRVMVVDPCHVGVVDVTLNQGGLVEAVGVDLDWLKDMQKWGAESLSVQDGYLAAEADGIVLYQEVVKNLEPAKPPQFKDWLAVFPVPTAWLHKALRGAEKVSDHATLVAKDGKFSIYAWGGKSRFEAHCPIEGIVEPCASMFSIDYLASLVGGLLSGPALVGVSLAQDMPIMVTWQGGCRGRFYLAPRIDSDPGCTPVGCPWLEPTEVTA